MFANWCDLAVGRLPQYTSSSPPAGWHQHAVTANAAAACGHFLNYSDWTEQPLLRPTCQRNGASCRFEVFGTINFHSSFLSTDSDRCHQLCLSNSSICHQAAMSQLHKKFSFMNWALNLKFLHWACGLVSPPVRVRECEQPSLSRRTSQRHHSPTLAYHNATTADRLAWTLDDNWWPHLRYHQLCLSLPSTSHQATVFKLHKKISFTNGTFNLKISQI